ncbi:MAG: adenylate kinase [Eubacteriales bacterium]|nr:adenylate kinase [Eubacteriales bacterium]
MRLIMLGAPGAGKGTQSTFFAERLNIPHISSGHLFRKNITEKTELGKEVQEIISRGELVPDRIVIAMMMERILQRDCGRGYILDGFPRTYEQATALKHALLEYGEQIDHALSLEVPDELIKKRMPSRLVCPDCDTSYSALNNPPLVPGVCDRCGAQLVTRADDNEETVSKRLETFHNETEPLKDYYRRKGILIEVDGTKNPDEVYKDIVRALVHHGNH